MAYNQGRRNICRVVDGYPLEAEAEIENGAFVVKHKLTGYCRQGAPGLADYELVGEACSYQSAKGKKDGEVVITCNEGDLYFVWAPTASPIDGRLLGRMMYVAGPRELTPEPAGNARGGRLICVEDNKPSTRGRPCITVVTV